MDEKIWKQGYWKTIFRIQMRSGDTVNSIKTILMKRSGSVKRPKTNQMKSGDTVWYQSKPEKSIGLVSILD